MDIKLTNGKKTIVKPKKYYEANIGFYQRNGFAPVDEAKKQIKKATTKNIADKVMKENKVEKVYKKAVNTLKSKVKKNVKKTKKASKKSME